MKNVYLLFVFIVLYACSNDDLNTLQEGSSFSDTELSTRSIDNMENYYFNFYASSNPILEYDFEGEYLTKPSCPVLSYFITDEQVIDLAPEIISKPDWLSIECRHVYYKIFEVIPTVDENTSGTERSSTIVLRQPESNKTLSIPVTQRSNVNIVTLNVTTVFKNRYKFTATTSYPIKGNNLTVDIPFVVYNDGGEMNEMARIVFDKGDTTAYTIKDYGPSPLVYYHGDLKGFRLSEGVIYPQDGDYNYAFDRYW